jgi:hypothetical protein
MRRTAHSLFVILLIGLFAVQPVAAYEYPLSPQTIREGYFLGKASADKREAFFAQYTKRFPQPESGPYISRVRVTTPYAYVVERTTHLPNLLAPDAQQEFCGKPISLRIQVHIDLTPTYGWQIRSPDGGVTLRGSDFWKDFNVRLIQDKTAIRPLEQRGEPVYSFASERTSSVLIGADIELEYDPKDVQSAPATVAVKTPEGQKIKATFDLAKLR